MSRHLYSVLFLIFLSINTYAQPDHLKFKRVSVKDGLSHVTVNCILQDSYGLIWLGTTDGLNLYDGYSFQVFKQDDADSSSLGNNIIGAIYEDENQNVWIGTSQGLYLYNRGNNNFNLISDKINKISIKSIIKKSDANLWIGSNAGLFSLNTNDTSLDKKEGSPAQIASLELDINGSLWIGTLTNGAFLFKDNRYSNFDLGEAANNIWDIHQDKKGQVWLASNGGGLYKYDSFSKQFSKKNIPKLTSDLALCIEEDSKGNLWIGTEDGGVNKIEINTNIIDIYTFDKNNNQSISGNIVRTIYEDNHGLIWLGTWGNGFNIYDPETSNFIHYQNDAKNDASLSHDFTHAVFEMQNNEIWVGTKKGLNILNPKTHQFQHIFSSRDNGSLSSNYIKSIFQDSKNRIWIGTQNGLNLRNNNTTFTQFFHHPKDSLSIVYNDITFTFEDSKNQIWIGTWNGLNLWNEENQTFQRLFENYQVLCMQEGEIGNLWIGTYSSGLIKFNQKNQTIEYFKHIEGNITSLPNNRIWTLLADDDNIWVGTFGGGLSKLVSENGKTSFTTWKEQDGLSSNAIIGILDDKKGNLWISGNYGISKFSKKQENFVNYNEEDGLQGNHFNVAYFSASNGFMYFGGSNGLSAFNPDSLSQVSNNENMLINGIELFNKPITIGENSPLKNDILKAQNIIFNHNENVFSFSFTGLDYSKPSMSEYAYRLKNFNDNWTYSNSLRRYVTYTNIPAGDYVFELKSLNRKGDLSKYSDSKYITILPPWWETWWFNTLLTLGIVSSFLGFYYNRINRIKAQKKNLELEVKERTKELELSKKQVEEDKIVIEKSLIERESLLREIHHRVKNNLQIIANLLYLQSGKFDDENIKNVLEEGQGRVRSMALIHQKLYENEDLKSIPFGEYVLELVNEIKVSFGEQAANVNIKVDAPETFFDVDSAVPLGLIINELSTNAFKYAFEGRDEGQFNIFLTKSGDEYELHISDNGKGIPEEIDIRKTRSLGLRLVRILSEQLEGEYEFENNGGMSFKLKFVA